MSTPKKTETTQGTVSAVISVLLDSVIDKNVAISDPVKKSLHKIAQKHPNDILRLCCQFCNKNKEQLKAANRVNVGTILSIMEGVCTEHIVLIDGDTILDLVAVSLDLMTENIQYEPIIQTPAVGVIVALGSKHCIQIVDSLTEKIMPGVVPHYTIVQSLGSLACTNVFGVVPNLKPILGLMLPLLGNLKPDHIKRAFAYSFANFCEAIIEYTSNLEQAPDPTITKDFFLTEMAMAYDVFFAQLPQIRDPLLLEDTLNAVSSIFAILSVDKVRQHTTKTVQILLALYKRHKESYPVTKCLSTVVNITSSMDGTLLEPQVNTLLLALAELIYIAPDYAQPEKLRAHSEALRCYQTVCTGYTDNCVDHLVTLMKASGEKERVRSLVVLTHLVNTSSDALRPRLEDIMAVLGDLVNGVRSEGSVWVNRALMKTVVALAYKEFLPSSSNETDKYLEYLVYLCIKTSTVPNNNATITDTAEMSDLKQSAGNNLYMLATSGKYLEGSLRRLLTQCLLNIDYAEASVVLLRCLTHLSSRTTTTTPTMTTVSLEITETTTESTTTETNNPFDTSTDSTTPKPTPVITISPHSHTEDLFIRCYTLLARPLPQYRGNFILTFLRHCRLYEEEEASGDSTVWETRVTQLLKYLETHYSCYSGGEDGEEDDENRFNTAEWEEMLLEFFGSVLERSKERERLGVRLVECISSQLPMYNKIPFFSDPNTTPSPSSSTHSLSSLSSLSSSNCHPHSAEKRHLLLALGVITTFLPSNHPQLATTLNLLLANARPAHPVELHACARGVGLMATRHLTLVLERLGTVRKETIGKHHRPGKLFQFLQRDAQQRLEVEVERLRYVVVASYGEICREAEETTANGELLRVVEGEMLTYVLAELAGAAGGRGEFGLRKVALETIGAIAECMHPNRNSLHIHMKEKEAVIQTVSSQLQLHSGPEYIELFPIIIPVLTSLIRLPHPLEAKDRQYLLKLVFDNVFNASAIYCKMGTESFGDLKLSPFVYASFSKVNNFVQELVIQTLTPAGLDEIATLVEWLNRKKPEQRLPALEALRSALFTYLDRVQFAFDTPTNFGQSGWLLAKVLPRCTDPHLSIRKVAVENVRLILSICGRYEGLMKDHDTSLHTALHPALSSLSSLDTSISTHLATVLSQHLPKHQIASFLTTLGHSGTELTSPPSQPSSLSVALVDVESGSSAGSAVVLAAVVASRGGELNQSQVDELAEQLLHVLPRVRCARTQRGVLEVFVELGRHHLRTVVGVLLVEPLPYDPCCKQIWATLSSDSALAVEMIDLLKKIPKNTPLFDASERHHLVALRPFQAISALEQVLQSSESRAHCIQQFPELFSTLFTTLAAYIDAAVPATSNSATGLQRPLNRDAYKLSPFRTCAVTLRHFLGGSDVAECGDTVTAVVGMIPALADHVCVEYGGHLSWLVACLGPYLHSETAVDMQRVAVALFLGSLLDGGRLNGQVVLAENILEMLVALHDDCGGSSSSSSRSNGNGKSDESDYHRGKLGAICMRAMGRTAEYFAGDLVQRHHGSILTVLMQGLDYSSSSEWEVALEAMLSLSKLLTAVPTNVLGQCHVTAAVRIKPFFQHEDAELRYASFSLLGDLATSVQADNDAFREQVNGNLISLLLHLNDVNTEVVKACKTTLRSVGPFLDCHRVNSMIQEHLLEEATLNFVQFITDLVKCMTEEMPALLPQLVTTCIFYLRSPWCEIRSHAALCAGLLYSQLDAAGQQQAGLDTVCYRLTQLLKDDQPAEVRASVAESLSLVLNT